VHVTFQAEYLSAFTVAIIYWIENEKFTVKPAYRKYYHSRTPNNKTPRVQGEAGFEQEAWSHETACAPSKWSQVHGHIPPSANLLLPLPWVYLVSFLFFHNVILTHLINNLILNMFMLEQSTGGWFCNSILEWGPHPCIAQFVGLRSVWPTSTIFVSS
jgi:hypothetical protein